MRIKTYTAIMMCILAAHNAIAQHVPDQEQHAPDQNTIVRVETGLLRGLVEDGVLVFRGIPYAAPPIGPLRWRDPQLPLKWNGIRDATSYGPPCMQVIPDTAPPALKPSEDCLLLHIWKPQHIDGSAPVMVFIHGGGFLTGYGWSHVTEGFEFAKRGIVLVCIEYRLGRFGFFAHPALTPEGKDEVLANYGLADQIAALKWVQRNIAAFGGNPKRVTIFGGSAGSFSVLAMLSSPLSKGLYEQAIVSSGGGGPIKDRFFSPYTFVEAEKAGEVFAKSVGIEGAGPDALEKLRALPAAAVTGDLSLPRSRVETDSYSGVTIDGKLLPGIPDEIFAKGGGAHVPLMIGTTTGDIAADWPNKLSKEEIFSEFGKSSDQARAAYDPGGNLPLATIRIDIGGDELVREPARVTARAFASRGEPTFEYRFGYVPVSKRDNTPAATHGMDVAFYFDRLVGKSISAADQSMANTMIGYWSSFAKTGDPNGDGRPAWPRYSTQKDELMFFGNDGAKVMADPWKNRLDIVQALFNEK